MSIFRETLTPQIREQLELRQESIRKENRSSNITQYFNSRNAWIRMSSSVNVGGTNQSAKQHVLQGGVLLNKNPNGIDVNKDFALKSGVGINFSNAYSRQSAEGVNYKFGIRPMPGIVSMDIKSKAAYGSLREIVISFQCWDIHQLEELELLYMRPGYTVLVEWGWLPYIERGKNNEAKLVSSPPDFYDILNKGETERTIIFKELYKKCLESNGNYDAMYGYIKNYSWSARTDGGYDCTTTIISTGEIIESLKVNYVRPDLADYDFYTSNPTNIGYIKDEFIGTLDPNRKDFLRQTYEKNTMAGMWAEVYLKLYQWDNNGNIKLNQDTGSAWYSPVDIAPYVDSHIYQYNSLAFTKISAFGSQQQFYITLDKALAFIEKYIVAKGSKGEPLLKLSLNSNTYSSDGAPLNCVAHPLQISVDPSICVIKSPIWYQSDTSPLVATLPAAEELNNKAGEIAVKLYESQLTLFGTGLLGDKGKLESAINDIFNYDGDKIELYNRAERYAGALNASKGGKNINIEGTINLVLGKDDVAIANNISDSLTRSGIPNKVKINRSRIIQGRTGTTIEKTTFEGITITTPPVSSISLTPNKINQALNVVKDLEKLKLNYFYNGDPYTEIGVIKNIYVNVDLLYREALDANLESSDQKEKNEINLYRYLKSIISKIQAAIGNVNNFEIHVDPIDSIARIIDINYTDPNKSTNLYDDLFQLEVQNLKSVVRSYSLQSQIFPDQSAVIAIGSQAKGGQLGIQNNTMIDFNNNLIDRITPKKEFPIKDTLHDPSRSKSIIATSLSGIVSCLGALGTPYTSNTSIDISSLFSSAKNNLRDLIVYFQSVVDSPGANRNLIPVKFSFEMDGIGGLVIGQLFKINEDVLPRGYKGGRVGSKLAQTIVRIGHSLQNNDWVTKVEALNIVLDDKKGKFKDINITQIVAEAVKTINTPTEGIGGGSPFARSVGGFNQNNITTAVQFFQSKGYTDYQTAAIVGALLQESGLNPSITNSIGATGIAQWLGNRKTKLLSKPDPTSLQTQLNYIIEEFNSSEKLAENKIRASQTLEEAIVGMAAYERFGGWRKNITYSELLLTSEVGNRVAYSNDILSRIRNRELNSSRTNFPSPTTTLPSPTKPFLTGLF